MSGQTVCWCWIVTDGVFFCDKYHILRRPGFVCALAVDYPTVGIAVYLA